MGLSKKKSRHDRREFLYIYSQIFTQMPHRYLATFQERTLQVFFAAFEKWELSEVLKDLEIPILTVDSSSTQSLSMAHLEPSTLYRMVSNWTIFCDSRIVFFFATHALPDSLPEWPQASIPPGILLFLLAEQDHLREWATSHVPKNTFIPFELFQGSYLLAIGAICNAIQHQLLDSASGQAPVVMDHYSFAQPLDFWNGMNTVLRLLPPQWLAGKVGKPVELRQAIMNHLRVQNPRS